ncbi:hypothetical protein DEU56DRAFT_31542 [Suillus clintonianus]|uniref:uncharacterized protein n=1 Tax=Suillus clintonianus TaxID=1904413 RepID=UPI001B885D1D|nr:uncharacterized protein DEU56DRAFT_31542 [Suillus clintonianus]KAG2150484.1 hypothetical protein DEU56DRAFT_31542 [Suillus clintonianus]
MSVVADAYFPEKRSTAQAEDNAMTSHRKAPRLLDPLLELYPLGSPLKHRPSLTIIQGIIPSSLLTNRGTKWRLIAFLRSTISGMYGTKKNLSESDVFEASKWAVPCELRRYSIYPCDTVVTFLPITTMQLPFFFGTVALMFCFALATLTLEAFPKRYSMANREKFDNEANHDDDIRQDDLVYLYDLWHSKRR